MKRLIVFTFVATTFACQPVEEDGVLLDAFGRSVHEPGREITYESAPEETVSTTESALVPGFTLSPYVSAGDPGSWPDAVAIGDVTGDGLADVVMTTTFYFSATADYRVYVYPQRANGTLGTFVSYPYNGTASRNGLVLVDLDEDSLLDVVVGHGQGISVLLADGAGGLLPAVVHTDGDSTVLSTFDVNQDGHADLVSLGWSRDSTIFFGDGLGGFSNTQTLVTNNGGFNDMEAEDVTGDGIIDLVVMNGVGAPPQISVHPGLAGGGFGTILGYSTPEGPRGLGLGDVTGDGRHDAVISRGRNSPTHLWIMAQNASGAFDAPTTIASYDIPETVEVTDLDGDDREDVIVLHGGWLRVGVYQQLDTGGLAAETLHNIPYASHYGMQGLAIGDFSGDDCNDVAIADYNQGLVVLYGQGCAAPIGPADAIRDPAWTAPICPSIATSCNSGALINGRAQITGGIEDGRPNTLGSCADGTFGSYHVDESLDRLAIRSASGDAIAAGDSVVVDATVWAWAANVDVLDVFVTSNPASPAWTFVGSVTGPQSGAQTLSLSFTLPAGSGLKAVRAQWRYFGSNVACSAGAYNDRDDLVFMAQ